MDPNKEKDHHAFKTWPGCAEISQNPVTAIT